MNLTKKAYAKTKDSLAVDEFTLTNSNGMSAKIITYGALLTSLKVPDRNGKPGEIVLGFDSLDRYEKDSPYFGATVGRVANRIAKGRFTLGGKQYKLALNNDDKHALHGGNKGFDKVVWKAKEIRSADAVGVEFSYLSPDGEEGYPGNLSLKVTYTLTRLNELKIDYRATTDKATPVNLTHHTYFNLADAGESDILGHAVMLKSNKFTPTDDEYIPTGEIKSVQGTPYDFTKPIRIGANIKKAGFGYDLNYVLNNNDGSLALAARVYEPKTGRVMEIFTTEPGIQLYTGNFLKDLKGRGSTVYNKHAAFCLETQHFPDSVNHPNFPSTILKPGETFKSTTVHKFTTK